MTSLTPPTESAPVPATPTNTLAVASLVLGVLGVLTSCVGIGAVLGLVALILGIIAISQTGHVERAKGRGAAIAGTILGGVSLLLIPILAIGILLPALGAARRTARQMQNSSQLRGVHQGMVMYAQGNKSWFPGVDAQGEPVDVTVEGRFQLLLNSNYFTGEYIVSPAETLTAWQPGAPLTPQNYSYAALDISENGGRRAEWSETLNAEAIVLGDRNAGSAADVYSVWTEPGGGWKGAVLWNDNHIGFESTHVLPTFYSAPRDAAYGRPGTRNPADDLFTAEGVGDAMLIHSGE